MGNIVARVDKEGIVRYTNNPSTAQFAGMFIERCVSERGVVAYYFLERKTRKNTGWSLSQQEYDQAMRVGAFIPVAQRKAVAQSVPASVPEPTYYQKSHDYATGRTVGQSRTTQHRATQAPQRQNSVATEPRQRQQQGGQRVVMSRGTVSGAQMPDNTAGFSMSYASNSSFFKEETPTFDTDVLQDSETEKKKGFFSRLFDGIKSFFVRPVVAPPTTKALPAPGETSSPNAPMLSATAVVSQRVASGRHYKSHQDADVPVIPRGRG